MSEMSESLRRLREAQFTVSKLEEAIRQAPLDQGLQFNYSSMQKLLGQFESSFLEACRLKQFEICKYKINSDLEDRYIASGVARSIQSFQGLFTSVYDALEKGPKKNARISDSTSEETELEIAYTYPGSLGIVFSINSERTLFAGKFDDSIDTLNQLIALDNEHEVRDAARKLGLPIIRRVYAWSSANFKSGYSVNVEWRRSDGNWRGREVSLGQLEKIISIVDAAAESDVLDIQIIGQLVGIDLKSRRFHFVVPDGADYRGSLGEAFSMSSMVEVGKMYSAQIRAVTIIKYATEIEDTSYTLVALNDPLV